MLVVRDILTVIFIIVGIVAVLLHFMSLNHLNSEISSLKAYFGGTSPKNEFFSEKGKILRGRVNLLKRLLIALFILVVIISYISQFF